MSRPSSWPVQSVATFVVVFLSASAPILAQTGGIHVDVTDAEGGDLLPGATVTLTNELGLVAPTSSRTNNDGRVEFPILQTGPGYTVEVAMPGFGTQRRPGLAVQGGRILLVAVSLGRPMQETVEVFDTTNVVELDQVGSRTKFSNEFIEGLPQEGRQYQNILPLAPGVLDNDGDGNPNVHGARTRDFRAEVSGVSNVDPLTGQWLSRVNADSIEALEVLPVGAGVEFGRAQGGFARIVQRQGTNEFEGTFNILYQSSRLSGQGAGNTDSTTEADFETLQPSLHLSGPLIRDKLWFRFSNEYVSKEDPVNLLVTSAVTTTEQLVLSNQLTWQVFPRHRLAFQWQYDPIEQRNLEISSAQLPESSFGLDRKGSTSSITWTGPLSPRLLMTGLVALQDYSNDILPSDGNAVQRCAPFTGIPSLNTARCRDLDSNNISGPWPETSLDNRRRLSARGQATFYWRLGSHSHQVKLGFVAEDEQYDRELTRRPSMTYEFMQSIFGNDSAEVPVRAAAPLVSRAEADGSNVGVYLEDQWKPANNLAVTLGLRADHEVIQAEGVTPIDLPGESAAYFRLLDELRLDPELFEFEARSLAASRSFTVYEDLAGLPEQLATTLEIDPANINTFIIELFQDYERKRQTETFRIANTNFSPRLSLAWDPWSDGNTKIAVSAGRYYDKIFLAVPLVESEPVESVTGMTAVWQGVRRPLTVTRDSFVVTPLVGRTVDRGLRTPYQDEFSLSIERRILPETTIKLSYIERQYRDQLQDVDINHLPGDYGFCGAQERTPFPSRFPSVVSVLVQSYGAGQTVYDPWADEQYIDTDPGPGDGRVDDCFGLQQVGGTEIFPFYFEIPDGRTDPYVQNPTWEEIFEVGNFNTSDYEAFVLELRRRMYRNWQLEASYTYSTAEGDAEDFNLLLGNEPNLREDERGFLTYDQRHVVKINATFLTYNGFRIGLGAIWQSGLPYSVLSEAELGFRVPPGYPFGTSSEQTRLRYPTGKRNDQRNPAFYNVDLLLGKDFSLGRAVVAQITGEVFNIFNDGSLIIENRTTGRNALVNGTRRFGRRYQLGLKLSF